MGTKTGISWTDATWNPIRGCSRVSEGCRNCYAEHIAYRFSGAGKPFEGLVQLDMHKSGMIVRVPKWNGKIKFVEEHLLDPLKWKKPRRIFVNSMSDLFHENVTDEMRDKIFAVMALCPQHTFQVLTKRPERMLEYLKDNDRYTARRVFDAAEAIDPENGYRFDVDIYWPLSNVHLGVSVEDQKTADARIPLLLQTPAAVRFISAEPLLEPVDLTELVVNRDGASLNALRANDVPPGDLATVLDWVIVGGESGPGARPMHPDWARSLRDQCKAAGVPFFFKQWGEWLPGQNDRYPHFEDTRFVAHHQDESWGLKESRPSGYVMWDEQGVLHPGGSRSYENHFPVHRWATRVGTKAAGCLLDGVEHHEFPAVLA